MPMSQWYRALAKVLAEQQVRLDRSASQLPKDLTLADPIAIHLESASLHLKRAVKDLRELADEVEVLENA